MESGTRVRKEQLLLLYHRRIGRMNKVNVMQNVRMSIVHIP